MLESVDLMQQHKFNMSEKQEVVLRYKSTSTPYYWEGQENEKFEQRVQNFEPSIHYVVEQEVIIQDIIISKGVDSILAIRQKTVVLPIVEPTVIKGIPMVRVRYS